MYMVLNLKIRFSVMINSRYRKLFFSFSCVLVSSYSSWSLIQETVTFPKTISIKRRKLSSRIVSQIRLGSRDLSPRSSKLRRREIEKWEWSHSSSMEQHFCDTCWELGWNNILIQKFKLMDLILTSMCNNKTQRQSLKPSSSELMQPRN